MTLTEFQPNHLVSLMGKVYVDGNNALLENSFTIMNDGEVIGCGGVKRLWPGVGEAWAIPSPKFRSHRKSALRLCRKGIMMILVNNPDLHRIQASVSDIKGETLAEYLDFECEGTMRKFGKDGEDYKLFALVR